MLKKDANIVGACSPNELTKATLWGEHAHAWSRFNACFYSAKSRRCGYLEM